MTKASASKKPAPADIRGMNIEPADGGVVTEVRMKSPPRSGSMGYVPEPEPQRAVHASLEDLHAHVTKHFGHHFKKSTGKK